MTHFYHSVNVSIYIFSNVVLSIAAILFICQLSALVLTVFQIWQLRLSRVEFQARRLSPASCSFHCDLMRQLPVSLCCLSGIFSSSRGSGHNGAVKSAAVQVLNHFLHLIGDNDDFEGSFISSGGNTIGIW